MTELFLLFRGRVISKGLWPSRSTDPLPVDFHLWGYIKDSAYNSNPRAL